LLNNLKQLNVATVPSFVVLTRSNDKAYVVAGQQSFENIYALYRKAQGKDTQLTADAERLLKQPLGKLEQLAMKQAGIEVPDSAVAQPKVRRF